MIRVETLLEVPNEKHAETCQVVRSQINLYATSAVIIWASYKSDCRDDSCLKEGD